MDCLSIKWLGLVSLTYFTFIYLNNVDECFQLIHVQLQVQSVSEPNTYRPHGVSVPLL